MINKQLRSFFSFSKKEFNGLLVFCLLLAGVLFFPAFYAWLYPPEVFNSAEFKQQVEAFRNSAEPTHTYSYKNFKEEAEESEFFTPEYFEFNPNGLAEADWSKLGLSKRQIRVIKNYESKGGKFYKKEDLQKIYSITPQDYQRLEPYIVIPQRSGSAHSANYPQYKKTYTREVPIIEINTADSSQLELLPGIGPAFVVRILKYKDRLGGFHSKEQLLEVWGLDSAKFDALKARVAIDASRIVKININSATFEVLKKHPYLSYKQMNAILKYRQQHGPFKSINDMKPIAILNEDILRKIAPYLDFR